MGMIKFSYEDEQNKIIEISMNAESDPPTIVKTIGDFLKISCGIEVEGDFRFTAPSPTETDDEIDWPTKFRVFLLSNHMYQAFITNLEKSDDFENYRELIEEESPENFIDSAFEWASTPEGLDTWRTLAIKWSAILDNEELV